MTLLLFLLDSVEKHLDEPKIPSKCIEQQADRTRRTIPLVRLCSRTPPYLILAAAAAQANVVADGAPAMTRWRMEQQDTKRRRMGPKLVPHIFPVDGAPNRRHISGHRLEKRHFSTSIPVKKHTKTESTARSWLSPAAGKTWLPHWRKRGGRVCEKSKNEYVLGRLLVHDQTYFLTESGIWEHKQIRSICP
jgi:hypothetical protein